MTVPTVQVTYSCALCGILQRKVNVPARDAEGIVPWIQQVMMPALARDHAGQSLGCLADSLTDLAIPINHEKIGGVVVQ